jgi:hypothetical protein
MGRPEKPVNKVGGVVAQFASELRKLRAQAGNPTYRELAQSAMFSSSVLSSAASGYRMPSLSVTLAFVTACGGDKEVWRQRWLTVTGGDVRSARSRPPGRPADCPPAPFQLPLRPRGFIGRASELAWLLTSGNTPIVISGPAGVGKSGLALHYAHAWAAVLTQGQLYADLGAHHHAGRAPSPYDILDGFLRALGVPGDQLTGTLDHRAGLFRTLLVERRLLVLLDNVWDEAQVRPLLVETDTSTTLLVSRKRLLGLRDVRRLHLAPLSRADSVAMIVATLPSAVMATPDDLDRLAEFCGDLPLALDLALRRIALRPPVKLRTVLDGWKQNGNALSQLSIGDLSMRDSLRSAYRTLSRPARILLHWLVRTAADDVNPLPSEEDELADELIDAGILTPTRHDNAFVRLSPLVRAFALELAGLTPHHNPRA